ncbi:hypothetical protein [Roseateles amylovorans]|jgi:DNA-binding response OmpR family regulator|uniref:Response regulatory domain-containing protein n=1 Tax=Roseateles amylovorans TaxID=2978473 RepID=A0ABY6B854_9BURK|nr:hypothetical protein [Roseateles amylovorans]UXH79386.1 hypothetical protein N4261_05505 [Roseateles amylovorans]
MHHRLLVVDDNVDLADAVAALAETWGWEARTCHSAKDGALVEEVFLPHVVITDVYKTATQGAHLAQELRQRRGDTLMLAAMSGCGGLMDLERRYPQLFDAAFEKPVSTDALRNLLRVAAEKLPAAR